MDFKNKTVWQRLASFVKDELGIELDDQQLRMFHSYILTERKDAADGRVYSREP